MGMRYFSKKVDELVFYQLARWLDLSYYMLPPLYFILLRLWLVVSDTRVWAGMFSMVWAVGTLVIVYYAFGKLATSILVIEPLFRYSMNFIRPDTMVMFFCTLAFYWTVKHREVMADACSVLALFTHPIGLFLFPFRVLVSSNRVQTTKTFGLIAIPFLLHIGYAMDSFTTDFMGNLGRETFVVHKVTYIITPTYQDGSIQSELWRYWGYLEFFKGYLWAMLAISTLIIFRKDKLLMSFIGSFVLINIIFNRNIAPNYLLHIFPVLMGYAGRWVSGGACIPKKN
jgi:hypothetical protein